MNIESMTGGLKPEDDYVLPEPPECEWVREGASFWIFEENGEFGFPRMGVEAEPHTWINRRYAANMAFADGRVLNGSGVGAMTAPIDAQGRPSILSGGPLTFQCLEPFRKWRVAFNGEVVDTNVSQQIANTVDRSRTIPLKYEIQLEMAAPAFVQDNSPAKFFKLGKGEQRDGLSVGLGWRLEQVFRGQGEVTIDGKRRDFKAVGMRVKRRSIRTDGLFLRGHCWQSAVFPDGRAFGYLAYPPHDDGHEPWHDGFIYQDGKMHRAKAIEAPWLRGIVGSGADVSVTLRSELGDTRIEGSTTLSTFRIANRDIWGLNLNQSGVRYTWDGQSALGMIERSAPSNLTTIVKKD